MKFALIALIIAICIPSCVPPDKDFEYDSKYTNRKTNCNKDDIVGVWVTSAKIWGSTASYRVVNKTLLIRPDGSGIERVPAHQVATDAVRYLQLTYEGGGVWTGSSSIGSKLKCYYTGNELLMDSWRWDLAYGTIRARYVFVRPDDAGAREDFLRARQ
jgi:hypothetical protein